MDANAFLAAIGGDRSQAHAFKAFGNALRQEWVILWTAWGKTGSGPSVSSYRLGGGGPKPRVEGSGSRTDGSPDSGGERLGPNPTAHWPFDHESSKSVHDTPPV